MFLTLPGDRTAAFEVTNLAGDGALDTVDALTSGKYKWPLTGDWFWTINIRFARDLEKLNHCYPNIIRICEQARVALPNYQLGWVAIRPPGRLTLVVHNVSTAARTAVVRSRAYLKYPTDRLTLAPAARPRWCGSSRPAAAGTTSRLPTPTTAPSAAASPTPWKAASRRSATR
jgi:hypothetical protein